MRSVCSVAVLCLVAGCAEVRPNAPRLPPEAMFELAGQFSLPPRTTFPPEVGPLFGGISGLAPEAGGRELFALSDDRDAPRLFRLRIDGEGPAFSVKPFETITLEAPRDGPARLDPEGIVLMHGELIVASEGVGQEPRVPPAILRYSRAGASVGQIDVRERYVPTPSGPLTRGVRPNYGFEGLTISPDAERLFTATETALVQDGETATIDAGTLARLLEYEARGGTFRPAREFIYPLERVDRPPFEVSLIVKGIVELLALSRTEMLTLERTYVENKATPGRGLNYARLYRISIEGAADVSGLESLKDARGLAQVRKTLVLDLGSVKGLGSALVPALDNFEALAFGPKLADGSPSLIIASDDNFSPNQRSWFLLFRIPNRWLTASSASSAATFVSR